MSVRVLALLFALLAGCGAGESAGGAGVPAPEFDLESLDGTRVALAALRGRPVIVDFWATWCAPCVFQIPVLNAFHAVNRERGVAVLGVSVDAGDREAVARFAAEQEIQYPVLLGDEALAQRFGAIGFPSLFVIDPAGRIASSHVGVVSEAELAEALEAALR